MLVNRCEQGAGGTETGGTKKRKKVQLNLGGLSMHSPDTATQSYSPPDVHDFPMAPTSSSKMKVMVQHEVKGPIPVPRRDRSRSLCVDKLPTFHKQPPSPVFDMKFRHLGTAKANAILGRRGSESSSATSASVDRLTVQATYGRWGQRETKTLVSHDKQIPFLLFFFPFQDDKKPACIWTYSVIPFTLVEVLLGWPLARGDSNFSIWYTLEVIDVASVSGDICWPHDSWGVPQVVKGWRMNKFSIQ